MLNNYIKFYFYGYLFAKNGVKIRKNNGYYSLTKNNKVIKIALKHKIYFNDLINEFEYYHSAVEPTLEDDKLVVDYTKPKLHTVRGYELHKIIFPSIPEPTVTAKQYLDFAKLDSSSVVLDLGAYSGLTSLIFDYEISKNNPCATGRVYSVEADIINLSCFIQNIQTYKDITNRNIQYIFAAVSDKDGYQEFISEGAMGANANIYTSLRNGNKVKVPSVRLSSIAKRFNLNKIDFIKCDIEGAERYIFNDKEFFEKYSPKIIVECHGIGKYATNDSVIDALSKYGYKCKIADTTIENYLPLIECVK